MSLEQSVNQDSNLSEEELILAEVTAQAEEMRKSYSDSEVVVENDQADSSEEEASTNEPIEEEVSGEENTEPEADNAVSDEEDIDVENMSFKKPLKLSDRGMELPINNMQELITLASQGLNFTRKTQELSGYRKLVDTVKSAGIDESDIQMLADIKSGNKTAINGLAEKYKVDLYDLDNDAVYKPEAQVNVPTEADYVAQEIMRDERLSAQFKDIVQYVPDSFKEALATDARVLRAFSDDVRSGVAQKILPEAMKTIAMNPNIDFIQAYMNADKNLSLAQSQQPQQELAPEVVQQVATKPTVANASSSAKAKVSISSGSQSQAKADDSLDVWENGLSDAELIRRIQIQADRYRNQ